MLKSNANETYALDILNSQLTADLKVLDQTDSEINRLQIKRKEMVNRIQYLQDSLVKLK